MTVNVSKPVVNVREKLAELDKPTGIAGEAMLRAETPQEQFNLIGAGRRNIFINGGFTVSQRGDYTSATATSTNAYGLDRWKNYLLGVTATYQNTTVTIEGVTRKALKMTATSSNTGFFGPVQHVELSAFRAGVPLTMSGYVRTNHPSVYFRHDYVGGVTGIQAPDPITPDGNWHYVTWTVDTTGTSVAPIFQVLTYNYGNVTITSGDYIEIADMQLEVGKVATPFEHRSYGEELALCQRYYYKHAGFGSTNIVGTAIAYDSDSIFIPIFFPVTMRGGPTLIQETGSSYYTFYSNGTNTNFTGFDSFQETTVNGTNLFNNGEPTGMTSGSVGWIRTLTSSALIAFDAEL